MGVQGLLAALRRPRISRGGADPLHVRRWRAIIAMAAVLAAFMAVGASAETTDTFRIRAGGTPDWSADGGNLDQTSSTQLSGSGTLTDDGTPGSAPYTVAAGPGVVRSTLSGTFHNTDRGLAGRGMTPRTIADSKTTLTVSGPPGPVNVSLNRHVNGTLLADCNQDASHFVCNAHASLLVDIPARLSRTTIHNTQLTSSNRNDLGLAIAPISDGTGDGFRISGDVSPAFTVDANQPFVVTLRLTLEHRVSGSNQTPTTWQHDFSDGMSFSPTGSALNVPAGYGVSGTSVTSNRWSDPFAAAPPEPDDEVSPVVTAVPDREPDHIGGLSVNGVPSEVWYNAPVTIDWQSVDPQPSSGRPTDPPNTVVEAEGENVVYESDPSCDPAGNCATGTTTISLDRTPPVITCPSPLPVFAAGGEALFVLDIRRSDNLSGLGEQTLHFADTSSVGEKSVVDTVSDNAGNQTTAGCSYRVEYDFSGFRTPVANPPSTNTVKAGQTVPLMWRLTDASGDPVTNLNAARVTAVTLPCSAGETIDRSVEQTQPLQNLGNGDYRLNWQTPHAYANSCKTMRLDLGEGAFRTALFRFRG